MQGRTLQRPILIAIVLIALLLLAVLIMAGTGNLKLFGTAAGAPAIVDLTYTALSNKLGQTVNTNNATFEWTLDTFPDTRIGCPDPSLTFQTVNTTGYKVVITYNGVAYDYRAKADNSGLFLCATTQTGTGTTSGSDTIAEPVALMDAILADVSTRANDTISRDNARYTYNYQLFAGSDLDCPLAGKTYDKVETWGWKIVVRPQAGGTYDYRGTSAGNFWLCTQ